MNAILVFIDGTICDTRPRHHLIGTPDFYQREAILSDRRAPGSTQCLQELAGRFEIHYISARPAFTHPFTEEWLQRERFPKGSVSLAETQEERLLIVKALAEKVDFFAGIGDRWDDNEIHSEIGCLSIILQEYEGKWDTVAQRIMGHYRRQKVKENEIHLI